MKLYVADTHALFWYFIASPLLGAQAQAAFDEAKQGQALIYIPAIVLAELYFLNEKKQSALRFDFLKRERRSEGGIDEIMEDFVHALGRIRHFLIEPPLQQDEQLAG